MTVTFSPSTTLLAPPSGMKAILMDVDKTLTRTDRVVTPRTRSAIQQLIAEGKYQVALCTGRPASQILDILEMFPAGSPHVFNGGGLVAQTDGEILDATMIPSEIVKEVANQSEQLGADFIFEHDRKVYGSQRRQQEAPDRYHSPQSLADWSTPLLCVPRINDQVRELLSQYDTLEVKEMVSEISGPYVDITVQGVNKGTGVQRWSEVTGIPVTDMVGFGDGGNDLEFLQTVGWSVAMGNAIPELKQVAKTVIGSCDDDSLAEYLEREFLS